MAKKITWNWKSILSIVVVIALLAGILGLAIGLSGKKTVSISPGEFSLGGIDDTGKYKNTKESIYTEEMFECKGLRVIPEFTFDASYKIFFYNYDAVLLSSTEKLEGNYIDNVPELAKYARIVIYPDTVEEIKWYQVKKYARQIDITVDYDQKYVLTNWFELDATREGTQVTYNPNAGTQGTNLYVQYVSYLHDGTSNADKTPLKPISITGWNQLAIVYDEDNYSTSELIYFFAKPMFDGDGERVESNTGEAQWSIVPAGTTNVRLVGNLKQVIIDVPDGATHFFANSFTDDDYHFSIYQYT